MKSLRKFLFSFAFIALMFSLASCQMGGGSKVTLDKIEIDTSDVVRSIAWGETFDYSQLKVTAIYSDAKSETISASNYTVDISAIKYDVAGTYIVTVEYKGIEETFEVVIQPAPVLVEIEASGAKQNFLIGEEFSKGDLVVTATLDDESEEVITDYTIDSSNYQANQAGEYTINLSYTLRSVTKTAEYTVVVVDNIKNLAVDTTNATVEFVKGASFSTNDLVVKAILLDDNEKVLSNYTYEIKDADGNIVTSLDQTGNYTVVVHYVSYEAEYSISVVLEGGFLEVATVEDFMAMRAYGVANVNTQNYKLTADLDFTGITFPDLSANLEFKGIFDGDGHTLSNITYAAGTSKVSPLFQYITGGTVKNVKIFAATVSSASETIGIVCAQAKVATFENIEFSCCTVNSTSSSGYAALLVARTQGGIVNASGITVKNLTSVSGIKYVGGLIGDGNGSAVITFNNCDIDVTVTSGSQNGAFLGRGRSGCQLNINNSIVDFHVGEGASVNKTGVFVDGSDAAVVNITNAVILGAESVTAPTKSDMLIGEGKATFTFTNCYYDSASTFPVVGAAGATAKALAEMDLAFFTTTVGLSTDVWEEDGSDVKLIVASSNIPGVDATVQSILLVDAAASKQFFAGEAFDSTGLIVTAIYSDGVVIALDPSQYEINIYDSVDELVPDFTVAGVGKYTVKVTAGTGLASYDVYLVAETGISVNDDQVRKVYLAEEVLDLSQLAVFLEISDNTHSLGSAATYSVVWMNYGDTVENDSAVALTAGHKTVKVQRIGKEGASFMYEFDINVLAATIDAGVVDVYVSATYEDLAVLNNGVCFNTIAEALDYIVALDLADEVRKVVHIAAGTYAEKLTVSTPNVIMIGEGADYTETVIEFDAAADTLIFDESKTYGTEGSATVTIKSSAIGFQATKIYFKNTFDYNGSLFTNKQALALFCQADQAVFESCGFISVQDTLEPKQGRQYYHNCYIAGAVDFIFGNNAAAIFDECEIHNVLRVDGEGQPQANQGYIAAPKGLSSGADIDAVVYNYVFLNCEFTADALVPVGSVSIARPWDVEAGVAVINCNLGAHISLLGYDGSVKSRYFDMSGNLPGDAHFYEYGNTGDGAINVAVDGMTMLTEPQAAVYTPENIFAANNGLLDLGSAWNVPALSYVLIGAKDSYLQNATFDEPKVIKTNICSAEAVVATFKIFNSNAEEVTAEVAMATLGNYSVKVFEADVEVTQFTFSVASADAPAVTAVTYTLNPSTMTTGDMKTTTTAGTNNFFSINSSESKYWTIDGNSKTIGDESFTQRLKTNGTSTATERTISFTTTGAATVTVYVMSGSSSKIRAMNVYQDLESGDTLVKTENVAGDVLYSVVFELEDAGTYYMGSGDSGMNFYFVKVIVQEPNE